MPHISYSKTPLVTDTELRTLREPQVFLTSPPPLQFPHLPEDPLDAFPKELEEMRSLWSSVKEPPKEPALSNADRRMCAEVIEKYRNPRTKRNARPGQSMSIDDIIASCNVQNNT